MRARLTTYLTYGNRLCGVEHFHVNGQEFINVSELKRQKNELIISSTYQVTSIENVAKKLSKQQHIALVVNNDKVLSKSIDSELRDHLKLVYKAFPNLSINDFYYNVVSQNNRHFISICRKDFIDSLINDYATHKLWVIDIFLGNSVFSQLTNYVDTDTITTSNASIQLEDQRITAIEPNDNLQEVNYHINDLDISSNYLLSTAGALDTVLKNAPVETNYGDTRLLITNAYKQARFFNVFMKVGGLFVLCLLLINFFVFNHYFEKVNRLQEVSQINSTSKERIMTLKASVDKKQKMITDVLKSNASKSSYYVDQIAKHLPETITLTEVNYQPLKTRVKPGKPIQLTEKEITITGASSDSEQFSGWIDTMQLLEWVDNIEIIDFGASSRQTSEFKLKLLIKA